MVLFTEHNANLFNTRFIWTKNGQDYTQILNINGTMKLEMPLIDSRDRLLGLLWLVKDMRNTNMSHYTLRRVEHLRRSVLKAVERLQK
jgi:UDP-GlcNAc:undecaprenyl-phosphate GlcNAc-1-phosphate transferase